MDDSVTLKFGRFELQARQRRLLQDGDPVPVGTRAFDVLVTLAERRDRVVTKAELLDLVWPGLVVEENNLQVQISTLRKLLGPQAIATIPGRGYQFTAALSDDDEAASPFKRRLAAILAADVAGYSRLMAADESATVVALDAARAVFREEIESRHGRVIDMAGDSVLAVFETATGAVAAALAVQQELDALTRRTPEDQRMRFRIGVHLGDVIQKSDGTIYGDGVNVAARLEQLAAAGGISVSDAVHGAVQGKVTAQFVDQGEQRVKNIDHPVRAFAVSFPGSIAAPPSGASGVIDLSLPHKPSIAVLPFAAMSGDLEQKFFADGVVEDIITALSRVRALFVIARNSSFAYEGKAVDVRQVGRELGVRYVLEGSVRRAADRVRITAQVIDATGGGHLWSEKYDRDLTDLFVLQDEITHDIVGVVAPQVLVAEMQRARRKDPQRLDAWEAAVRAQWHLAQLTREDNAEALRLAMKSAEQDPGDTAGLDIAAFAHIYDAVYGWSGSAGASFMAANQVARAAVSLDARDEVAQTALGATELFLGQHDSAMAHLHTAVALNPNFSWAHGNLGLGLTLAGNGEEAVASLKEALRLSPIDRFTFLWINLLGFAMFPAGPRRGGARSRRAIAPRTAELSRPLSDSCRLPEPVGTHGRSPDVDRAVPAAGAECIAPQPEGAGAAHAGCRLRALCPSPEAGRPARVGRSVRRSPQRSQAPQPRLLGTLTIQALGPGAALGIATGVQDAQGVCQQARTVATADAMADLGSLGGRRQRAFGQARLRRARPLVLLAVDRDRGRPRYRPQGSGRGLRDLARRRPGNRGHDDRRLGVRLELGDDRALRGHRVDRRRGRRRRSLGQRRRPPAQRGQSHQSGERDRQRCAPVRAAIRSLRRERHAFALQGITLGRRAFRRHRRRRGARAAGLDRHPPRGRRDLAAKRTSNRLDVARPIAGREGEGPVDGGEQAGRNPRQRQRRKGRQSVVRSARHRGGRCAAGDDEIERRAERVKVRPRPLADAAFVGVLLQRRELRLEMGREPLRAAGDGAARATEVEQHRPAIGQHEDVVGRDVAVTDAVRVQQLERAEQRLDQGPQPGFARRRRHLQAHVLQRAARVVRHRHVGGGVAPPEAMHFNQRRMIEAREQPGLAEERFEALGEGLGASAGAGAKRHRGPFAAPRQRRRHVLLDGDVALQHVVARQIDDAEAAGAEDAQDLELFEKTRARPQGVANRDLLRPRRQPGFGSGGGPA